MPATRTAFGITYYSLSLHDIRKLRSLHDIPRAWWPILRRTGNYEPRNRIDFRDGAWPQLGAVDHIGAGFEDRAGLDTGAELLTEYGLNPSNKRASWNVGGDSDTVCLLAPGDVRPWQHGVSGSPFDLNSYGIGYEDGILSPDWRRLPVDKAEAHYTMRAAWWALCVGTLGWPLKYTPTPQGVWDHIRRGESWGFTQHGIMDPTNRTDAGLVWQGGRRINTFDYDRMFRKIRQEMQLRTAGVISTPGLPDMTEQTKRLQKTLNDVGYNLDVDGSFGKLTVVAAQDAAADTDFTGDIRSAAFITHLEDFMGKMQDMFDGLVPKVVAGVMGTRFPGAGNERLDDIIVATWRASRANTAELAALKAALEALAANQGVDPAEVTRIVRDGVAGALGSLEADVTLQVKGAAETPKAV